MQRVFAKTWNDFDISPYHKKQNFILKEAIYILGL